MLDSGAVEHCAPSSWKGWGQKNLMEGQLVLLKGVDGKHLEQQGQLGQEKFKFLVKSNKGVEVVLEVVFVLCKR
eukprot:429967-Amphidinium_carterae.3